MAVVEEYGAHVAARASDRYGLGLVRNTSSFGRKRIAVSKRRTMDCVAFSPPSRRCFLEVLRGGEKSALEELPQEILIRILCCVEHDDLKTLIFVSRSIREATLIAKQIHFAYTTPRKTIGFHKVDGEVAVPNALKQLRFPRKELRGKALADITVALFTSDDNQPIVFHSIASGSLPFHRSDF